MRAAAAGAAAAAMGRVYVRAHRSEKLPKVLRLPFHQTEDVKHSAVNLRNVTECRHVTFQ